MKPLLFTCPTTKLKAPTELATDVDSLKNFWFKSLKRQCPHCGQVHLISVREAYLENTLNDAEPLLRRFSADMIKRSRARPPHVRS
jgi:hypothetical protein